MEELNLLRKRKGMTISRAWMLMIGVFVLFFLLSVVAGIIQGVAQAQSGEKANMYILVNGIFLGLTLCFSIGSWVGYRINKKDVAKLQKMTAKELFLSVVLVICLSYILAFLTDALRLDMKNGEMIGGFMKWFGPLMSVVMTYFQVGVIGHGLLRNYSFRESILTVLFLCMILTVPAAVISWAFVSVIFFYVYYRTQNITIPLVLTLLVYYLDLIMKEILSIDYVSFENYYRRVIPIKDTLFYVSLVVVLVAIMFLVYKIVEGKNVKQWRNEEEYEDIF